MCCVVTDKCVDCTTRPCLPVCPINCFFETDGKMVYASQDECFECLCCYMACPKEAIYVESALPPERWRWKEINALACRSPEAKRLGQTAVDVVAGMRSYVPGRFAATAYNGMPQPLRRERPPQPEQKPPATGAGAAAASAQGGGRVRLDGAGYTPA